MDTVDEWIQEPEREIDKPFLMPIEDVFSITGRGTVATGRIETGRCKVGDEVPACRMPNTSAMLSLPCRNWSTRD